MNCEMRQLGLGNSPKSERRFSPFGRIEPGPIRAKALDEHLATGPLLNRDQHVDRVHLPPSNLREAAGRITNGVVAKVLEERLLGS